MIIDDLEYEDEEEWRVARVSNARLSGEEHRIHTNHHGEMRQNHYVCLDCKSVYFDGRSRTEDSPVVVHGDIQINEKFVDFLVNLAARMGEDLPALQRFIEEIVSEYGLVYEVPDLEKYRAKLLADEEGSGP